MAHIHDLDDFILWRIFIYIIRVPPKNNGDINDYIPLFKTSTIWQNILTRHFCSYACIAYTNSKEGKIVYTSPNTNIDYIRASGLQSCVHTLFINIWRCYDFYKSMNYIISHYLSKDGYWPEVYELTIYYKYDYSKFPSNITSMRHSNAVQQCTHLAKQIVDLIPNIEHLSLDISDIIPYNFESTLIGAYGRQLRGLICTNAIIPKSLTYFANILTQLSLDFSRMNFNYFPVVLSDSLEYLELKGLPYKFSLCHFAHHDRTMKVYFPNLERLDLGYKDDPKLYYNFNTTDDAAEIFVKKPYHCDVYAPNLTHLELTNPSPYCDILYSISDLKIKHLYLSGSIQIIKFFTSLSLNTLRSLSLSFNILAGPLDPNFYSVTNHFSKQLLGGCKLIFTFKGQQLYLDSSKIEWQNLVSLEIISPISLNSILSILQRPNNIQYMNIDNLVSDSTTSYTIQLNMDLAKDVVPISNKLSGLSVMRKANYNSVTYQQMFEAVKYLMTATPSLTHILILEEFFDDIKTYSYSNVSKYPHLKNVEFI